MRVSIHHVSKYHAVIGFSDIFVNLIFVNFEYLTVIIENSHKKNKISILGTIQIYYTML